MAQPTPDDQDWQADQRVRVRRGSFRDFIGSIATIDRPRKKLGVKLYLFNRPMVVELEFADIEKVRGSRGW